MRPARPGAIHSTMDSLPLAERRERMTSFIRLIDAVTETELRLSAELASQRRAWLLRYCAGDEEEANAVDCRAPAKHPAPAPVGDQSPDYF
jgi:hypothetical protein